MINFVHVYANHENGSLIPTLRETIAEIQLVRKGKIKDIIPVAAKAIFDKSQVTEVLVVYEESNGESSNTPT